jgi:hypothetical protein
MPWFLNLGSEVQVLSGTPFEIKGIIGMIKATYCAWVTPGNTRVIDRLIPVGLLRVGSGNIILESLEIGGDFLPILLGKSPGSLEHLTKIWPVPGVLFEKLGQAGQWMRRPPAIERLTKGTSLIRNRRIVVSGRKAVYFSVARNVHFRPLVTFTAQSAMPALRRFQPAGMRK